MFDYTRAFKKFSPKLDDYIRLSTDLSGDCRSVSEAREKILSFGRTFFTQSDYAKELSGQAQSFALRVLESSRIWTGIERSLASVLREGSHEAECRPREDRWSEGHQGGGSGIFLEKLLRSISSGHAKRSQRCADRGDETGLMSRPRISLQSPEVMTKIREWIESVDLLVNAIPDDESSPLPPTEKVSPLLKEKYCLYFQTLVGTLHAHAAMSDELAREEKQVVRLLEGEGIMVEWPDADIRDTTPEFRVVIDPAATRPVDTLPCLRWRDGWLAGERAIPATRTV